MDFIGGAVSRVLSSKPIHLAHPSSAGLSDLYADVSNSSSHLVETVNRNGTIRIAGNNLQLQATTNYIVSSPLLIYNPCLHLSITVPATAVLNDGWGLLAIDTFDLSIPNSLAQNMTLSGSAMLDYLLFCQPDPEKRSIVLRQCGKASVGAGTYTCSIPLAFLINRTTVSNSFPLDMSTMSGFLQINVGWKSARQFMCDNSANGGIVFPTAWNNAVLTFSNSSIMDAGFAIKNALVDPMTTYNIPEVWVQQYKYNLSIQANSGTTYNQQVTSAPPGMVHGFLMNVKDTNEINGSANGQTALFPSGVNLSSLRVEYSGQDLFRADSPSELESHLRYHFDGDDLSYEAQFYRARVVAQRDKLVGRVYFVPFNYNSSKVRNHSHLENLPPYSGATIDISFTVDPTHNRTYYPIGAPFTETSLPTAGAGGPTNYTIEITWICSALMEINQSSVDIQR